MTDAAPKIDFTLPVDPRSHAWCSTEGCGWKAWGIWAHVKARDHHVESIHMVHLNAPDTDEAKAARAAYLDEREAERARDFELAELQERDQRDAEI